MIIGKGRSDGSILAREERSRTTEGYKSTKKSRKVSPLPPFPSLSASLLLLFSILPCRIVLLLIYLFRLQELKDLLAKAEKRYMKKKLKRKMVKKEEEKRKKRKKEKRHKSRRDSGSSSSDSSGSESDSESGNDRKKEVRLPPLPLPSSRLSPLPRLLI